MNSHPKLRATLWLALLFAAGMVTGGTAMVRRPVSYYREAARAGIPVEEAWRARRMANLRALLAISPEQEERLAPLMDDTVAELRGVRERLRERTAKIVGRNSEATRAELTDAQRAAFDAWLQDHQTRRAEAGKGLRSHARQQDGIGPAETSP